MSHILNIAVKWVLAFLVLMLIAFIFVGGDNVISGYNLTNLLILSFGVAVISYLLGDLLILPRAGNIITSAADFVIALATLWLMDYVMLTYFTLSSILYASLVIAIGEFLFHIYLENRLEKRRRERSDF